MSLYEHELNELRKSAGFLSMYSEGLSAFFRSGIFTFLRRKGTARLIYNAEQNALEGARSAGYNEALDDIMYFRQLYLETSSVPTKPPTYGALNNLEDNLTKEELDAVRTGRKPRYPAPNN